MSIQVMSRVWDKSKASESSLLVLLALADRANEDGVAWPGLATVSQCARINERHTRRILRRLEETGEIYVASGAGRTHTSMYLVCVGLSADEIAGILVRRFEMPVSEAVSTAQDIVEKGGLQAQKGACTPPFGEDEKTEKGAYRREKGAYRPPDPIEPIDPSDQYATRATAPAAVPTAEVSQPPAPAPATPAVAPQQAPATQPVPATDDDYRAVVKVYENEIGLLTPVISASIKEQLRQCPTVWLEMAIGIAVKRNHRRWSYVEGILRRWHAEGFDGERDNLTASSHGRRDTTSKSSGYGRQQRNGLAQKGQPTLDDLANDPEMLEYVKTFIDARDGSRAFAAD